MSRQAVLLANSVSYGLAPQSITPTNQARTIGDFAAILEGLPDPYRFHTVKLLDKPPAQVKSQLRRAAERAAKSDSLLLFYYFGHGDLSGDLEVLFIHPGLTRKGHETLKLSAVEQIIQIEGVRRSLVIVDCCYAGAKSRSLPIPLAGEHCRLASTTPADYAYVKSGDIRDPIGQFTRAILDGFASERACRSAHDNSVTADTLFRFAERITRKATNNIQTPVMLGSLSEILFEYEPQPSTEEGFSDWADEKSSYVKLWAICNTLADRKFSGIAALHAAVIHQHRESFVTLFQRDDGDFTYVPVKPLVITRYVRFLRELGLVATDELRLTKAGERLVRDGECKYNVNLLLAIDSYLERIQLARPIILESLRQILSNRQVPSRQVVYNYFSTSSRRIPKFELGIILEAFGYIRIVQVADQRAYFPWT